jgi:hypothetical protein
MPQVLVWKSTQDGKLFEDKAKYQRHLRVLAAERRQQRKIEAQRQERKLFIQRMGQVVNFDELNQFIKDNWSWFFINALDRNTWRSLKPHKLHEFVDVRITETRWSDCMSNSHSCPQGGVMNFMSKDNQPRGYPGWRGTVIIKVRPPMSNHKKKPYLLDGFGSDYFAGTIIHTGSGGGGGGESFKSYSYDVSLWAADFPVMWEAKMKEIYINRENRRRQNQWKYLGGNTSSVPLITDVPPDWVLPDPFKVPDHA